MRKFVLYFLCLAIALSATIFAPTAQALDPIQTKNFTSDITINQDTTITVIETITVNYTDPHHGIFRDIPERNLKVLSVTDDTGSLVKYEVSGGNIKNIKIGDPDVEVTGEHTYVITYQVRDIVKEFPEHYELYWNVTGSNWEDSFPASLASVHSDFADITKVDCFAGFVGSSAHDCEKNFDKSSASFTSLVPTGADSDFTIVVALNKTNSLIFPTQTQRIINYLIEHWYYLLTPLPFLIPFYFWLKKGRDQRYASDNIYYKPTDAATRTVGIFERKFIPLVYSPIKGLTPAQVGTIADQKVDMPDVVAEITEIARLGYLKIKKIPKKGIFGKDDYEFTKLKEDTSKLPRYQQIIMEGLFEDGSTVLLKDLKNKFYIHLGKFKEALYEDMKTNGFYDGNPESVRGTWMVAVFVLAFILHFVLSIFVNDGEIGLPTLFIVVSGVLGFLFARAMPRRTPNGYALFRQTEGLAWYLKKGLWRQEIAEKKLFIDEILPLAISLGVVHELSKDMAALGMQPPRYVSGTTVNSFSSDMSSFQSSMGSTLASSPGGKGGSGFSGGSSGGGGGGGGGGGW